METENKKLITRQEKQKYRQSREWKSFRDLMKQRQKCCALCGAPLRGRWNLHHVKNCLTLEEYTSKRQSDFLCLCNQCHSFAHWAARKKSTSKFFIKIKQLLKSIGFGDDWVKFF